MGVDSFTGYHLFITRNKRGATVVNRQADSLQGVSADYSLPVHID